MSWSHPGRWIGAVAVVAPVAAGAALIPLRGRVDNANVALVLVVVVVAVAAMGRRIAAVLAALSAAAAFTLFHTEPYLSLRIYSSDDLETTLLLLVVGIAVGELALRGRRAQAAAERGRQDLATIQGLGALVATGEDPDLILLATSAELTHLLGLADCRFEAGAADERTLPVVQRDGTVRWGPTPWDTSRWGLPSEGAIIPVWSRGRRRGRFVLCAPAMVRIGPDELARAAALVDQAGAALAARPSAA